MAPVLLRFEILLLAAGVALAGWCHAAETATPPASTPAAERDAGVGQAGKPAAQATKVPATELKFETPPVPDFMLKKPEKALTIEEMKRQADEAAERSRRAREQGQASSPAPGTNAGPAGEAQAQPKK